MRSRLLTPCERFVYSRPIRSACFTSAKNERLISFIGWTEGIRFVPIRRFVDSIVAAINGGDKKMIRHTMELLRDNIYTVSVSFGKVCAAIGIAAAETQDVELVWFVFRKLPLITSCESSYTAHIHTEDFINNSLHPAIKSGNLRIMLLIRKLTPLSGGYPATITWDTGEMSTNAYKLFKRWRSKPGIAISSPMPFAKGCLGMSAEAGNLKLVKRILRDCDIPLTTLGQATEIATINRKMRVARYLLAYQKTKYGL